MAFCFAGAILETLETFGAGFLVLPFLLVLVTCASLGTSAVAGGVVVGVGSGVTWTKRPPARQKAVDGPAAPPVAPVFATAPAGARLGFLPLSASSIVCGVVSAATAAFKLPFGGRTLV